MNPRALRVGTPLLPLFLLLGCGGSSSNRHSDPAINNVTLNLVGQFEKRVLTPSGLSASTTVMPARYCYVEILGSGGAGVLSSGFLGNLGTASTEVPAGSQVTMVLYPQFEVPAGTGTDFFFHGSVKNAAPAAAYADITAFNAVPNWSVSSDTIAATSNGTLTVKALNSSPNREAGAFNIADQAVSFAQTVQALEPALRLPNLHVFWQGGSSATGFPALATSGTGALLRQASGRAVFQMPVGRAATGTLFTGVDEFNDGILQQRFASLLFAPYSYPGDGSAPDAVIRGDNDTFGQTSRGYQGESTAAFKTGFCDFFSAAVRNSNSLVELDTTGQPSTFYLDVHDRTYFPHAAGQGEFYSDAVAVSLYGIWKTSLGGGAPGLQTLWNATFASAPGALLNAPLGCYPTYLTGLAQGVTASAWTSILGQLALEDILDVTSPAYFAGNALWTTQSKPFSLTGALKTYSAATGIYYDRNQAQATRFTQAVQGPCTLTMTPLDGQDFYLELIGHNGVVAGSYDRRTSAQPRTLSFTTLPAGTYAVRVRVGYTSADVAAARYTLAVN